MKKITIWTSGNVPQFSCSSMLTTFDAFDKMVEEMKKHGVTVVRGPVGERDYVDDGVGPVEKAYVLFPDDRYLSGFVRGQEFTIHVDDTDHDTLVAVHDMARAAGLDPKKVVFVDDGGGGAGVSAYDEVVSLRNVTVVHVRVTDRCNSVGRCRAYCYEPPMQNGTDISINALVETLREDFRSARADSLHVTLGGGEPTLCPHLAEVVVALKSTPAVFSVNMTTNGVKMHPRWSEFKWAVHGVAVSVDSLRYGSFSEVPTAVTRNIKKYGESGVNVYLNVVISPENIGDVGEAYKFATGPFAGVVSGINYLSLKRDGKMTLDVSHIKKIRGEIAELEKKSVRGSPALYVDECMAFALGEVDCRERVAVVDVYGGVDVGCPFGCSCKPPDPGEGREK